MRRILLTLLLLWSVPVLAVDTATPTRTNTPTPMNTPTPAGSVVIVFNPNPATVANGSTFSVQVKVQAGSQEVDAAGAYVDYDPGILQVVSVVQDSALPVVFDNDFATPGQINFSSAHLGSPFPTGTFTLCTITFTAINASGGTTLHFVYTPARLTVAARSGISVTDHAENGTVVVNAVATPTHTHTPTVAPTRPTTCCNMPNACSVPIGDSCPVGATPVPGATCM